MRWREEKEEEEKWGAVQKVQVQSMSHVTTHAPLIHCSMIHDILFCWETKSVLFYILYSDFKASKPLFMCFCQANIPDQI